MSTIVCELVRPCPVAVAIVAAIALSAVPRSVGAANGFPERTAAAAADFQRPGGRSLLHGAMNRPTSVLGSVLSSRRATSGSKRRRLQKRQLVYYTPKLVPETSTATYKTTEEYRFIPSTKRSDELKIDPAWEQGIDSNWFDFIDPTGPPLS